jgi:hypothetical protein
MKRFLAQCLPLLTFACVGLGSSAGAPPAAPAPGSALQEYVRLPLSFERNQGQADDRFRFLARGHRYGIFLGSAEAVLSLQPATAQGPPSFIRMRMAGANPQPGIRGLDQQPGSINYLIGDDPQAWRRDVPHYARVEYAGVYPGIDLVFHGWQRQLEYDFVVAPRADPAKIRLVFDGVQGVRIDPAGDLVLHTLAGDISFLKPVIYQEIDGERRIVQGRYVRTARNEVGFRVAAYDRSQPLVIDPVLVYSTFLGGSKDDQARGVAVDASGSAYIVGDTNSTNFPTTSPFQASIRSASGPDIFVTKLNAAGTARVYSTYLGGTGFENARGIAVDGSGNAYVTGVTYSTDFPRVNAAQTVPGDNGFFGDAFVSKLNAAGSALVYSTYLGGNGADVSIGSQVRGGNLIAVDAAGNAYVTGDTDSTNFPVSAGAFQAVRGSSSGNAYVTKFSPTGARLYSTYLGGTGGDSGHAIAVDASGSAYVTGTTNSSDFPTTAGAYSRTSCFGCFFVTKMNATGTALAYSTFIGSGSANAIALDSGANAYITGYVGSGLPTTAGSFQPSGAGSLDAFVVKLNASGSALGYATYLGGGGNDQGLAIAVDAAGQAYVVGDTNSSDFPVTPGSLQPAFAGGTGNFSTDAFVAKLNATGGLLLYSTYLGGSGGDAAYGVAVDALGGVYVAGNTISADFPTAGAIQPTYAGSGGNLTTGDAFLAKLDLANRLGNISTRMQVLTGNDVMIGGFIVGGSTSKTVVVNVAGPSLANFGITNPLANPTLTLVRSSDQSAIATNDDWQTQTVPSDVAAIQASGFQPNHAKEPAIIATLPPGAYTAIVQGVGGTTGVGLVGVFEVDHIEIPLINISTRGRVLTGNDVMIAGFIIQGASPKTVVINVAGPSLANFGITSPLANPTLTLVRSSDQAVIATNDDWQSQSAANVTAIQNSGFKPNHALEPAIIATLVPGAYTAIVQGVAGGTGVGLVGVFTFP